MIVKIKKYFFDSKRYSLDASSSYDDSIIHCVVKDEIRNIIIQQTSTDLTGYWVENATIMEMNHDEILYLQEIQWWIDPLSEYYG